MAKRLIFPLLSILILGLFPGCASNTEALQETEKKIKALETRSNQFQQMAAKKISALEKDVKALKSNQAKLAKQIPAIVKQIKVLKAGLAKAGKGVTPEMEAQLNAVLADLEALEKDLATVKETGVTPPEEPVEVEEEEEEPFDLIQGSDQELVYREYGRPAERYTIAGQQQVWLYDGGVAVFDKAGGLVSLKFE